MQEMTSSHNIDTAMSLMTEETKIIILNIVSRGDKYKETWGNVQQSDK